MEIQELVDKLQEEGVSKGKQQADQILADAEKEKERLIEEAKKEAANITKQAEEEAKKIVDNGKNSLELASRDVLLKLEKDVTQVFDRIMTKELNTSFQSEELIKKLLESLLAQHKDGSSQVTLDAAISSDVKSWLQNELKAEVSEKKNLGGFQVGQADGGSVEVSKDSIREVLLPYLRGVAQEVISQEK